MTIFITHTPTSTHLHLHTYTPLHTHTPLQTHAPTHTRTYTHTHPYTPIYQYLKITTTMSKVQIHLIFFFKFQMLSTRNKQNDNLFSHFINYSVEA